MRSEIASGRKASDGVIPSESGLRSLRAPCFQQARGQALPAEALAPAGDAELDDVGLIDRFALRGAHFGP